MVGVAVAAPRRRAPRSGSKPASTAEARSPAAARDWPPPRPGCARNIGVGRPRRVGGGGEFVPAHLRQLPPAAAVIGIRRLAVRHRDHLHSDAAAGEHRRGGAEAQRLVVGVRRDEHQRRAVVDVQRRKVALPLRPHRSGGTALGDRLRRQSRAVGVGSVTTRGIAGGAEFHTSRRDRISAVAVRAVLFDYSGTLFRLEEDDSWFDGHDRSTSGRSTGTCRPS